MASGILVSESLSVSLHWCIAPLGVLSDKDVKVLPDFDFDVFELECLAPRRTACFPEL